MYDKKIIIIAGEESGDIYGAQLAASLHSQIKNLKISGLGGERMRTAKVNIIANTVELAVTGLIEIAANFFKFKKIYQKLKLELKKNKPDLLILIDYPGFNLRLAKYAKKQLGLKILYYISPQIWAWKYNRINVIKKYVDHMAVIFPFEKDIYAKKNIPVTFVGHPLLLDSNFNKNKITNGSRLTIAFLPGSRKNEVRQHLPILIKTAQLLQQQYPDLTFIIPAAPTLGIKFLQSFCPADIKNLRFVNTKAADVMAKADLVVVASGTASLEAALLLKPMCIIYKSSFTTYILAMKLIRVKFLGLCNLLANKMIVPELLQYDCNPKTLTWVILRLLTNQKAKNSMLANLTAVKKLLYTAAADESLDKLVIKLLE